MCCPICEYEMRPGQADCPRCSFRRVVRAFPPPTDKREAPAAAPPPLASPPRDVAGPPPAPTAARHPWAAPVLLGAALAALLLAFFLHHQAGRLTTREAQIQTIFTASDGPCRQGNSAVCMASVAHVRALGDLPDGSLLLGDCKIARYLPTQPGGAALAARWQRDTITVPELTHMGDVAYAQRLNVCRSFWMYAQIKRDHVPVPQYVFSGTGL